MKKTTTLLFIFCLIVQRSVAQTEDIWILGSIEIDFRTNPPIGRTISNYASGGESNASVCDPKGNLLFYTNGEAIWDKTHNLMPNGNQLAESFGVGSTTQGALIVPHPANSQTFYVFSLTSMENGANAGRLYYSIIDMRLNGGLGDIIRNQKSILIDSGLTEKMTAITGNNCNIWVVTRSRLSAAYKSYEVNITGIKAPVISNTGLLPYNNYMFGEIIGAPNGKKIVSASATLFSGGGLEIYDFDGGTGRLTAPLLLDSKMAYYSVSFSPGQSKIYAKRMSVPASVYQFDLNASDSASSKIELGHICEPGKIKLGRDGKIYFQNSRQLNGVPRLLGRITHPDNVGALCGFDPEIITSDTFIHFGLPNHVPLLRKDTFNATQVITAPCFSSSLPLQVNHVESWGYQWDNGHNTATRTAREPGTYYVQYFSPPCNFHTDTFHVSFPLGILPRVIVRPNCYNETKGMAYATTYSNDPVEYDYVWKDKDDNILSRTDTLKNVIAGSYTLHIRTKYCDTSLTVIIPELKHRASFETDSLACAGVSLKIQNTSPSYFNHFQWVLGEDNRDTVRQPSVLFKRRGMYRIQLIAYGDDCSDTAWQEITVDTMPANLLLIKSRAFLCQGEAVTLNLATDYTVERYNWTLGDGTSLHTSQGTIKHAYDQAGMMKIELDIIPRVCPLLKLSDSIRVVPFPIIDLGKDSSLCFSNQPIVLNNKASENALYVYTWSTGDTLPFIKITNPGRYSLTLTDKYGCSNRGSIHIKKACYLDIPNAFTPNSDGYNDYFLPRRPPGAYWERFSMQVYNRWGQIVFETRLMNGQGWDGLFSGKPQPEGVYIYRIEIHLNGGQSELYSGNLSLIR